MRQSLRPKGVQETEYEIRGIVQKARRLQDLGKNIIWENIGDPIQKKAVIPDWMKQVVIDLASEDRSYGYCDSKGDPATRSFLAERNNRAGGAQITANDILFFNGLGDAISTLYSMLSPTARILCPSPAYSTHGSAEAVHAGTAPLTYQLDPHNNWYPDIEEMRRKIRYNPSITGILIVNPDNPTGMVYPRDILDEIVKIASEYDLFLISDEIYHAIAFPGATPVALSEVVGDVPGIAMKGISKEIPWPGSRCGWIECYNRDVDPEFDSFCTSLDNAKMMEVCSTTLPQLAIPRLLDDKRFRRYRNQVNTDLAKRNEVLGEYLCDMPGIRFNPSQGTFYNSIVFEKGILNDQQHLPVQEKPVRTLLSQWVKNAEPDTRFVYYLLASTGICVVPLSSFHSSLQGFRITLLEEDPEHMRSTFGILREAIRTYIHSAHTYRKAL